MKSIAVFAGALALASCVLPLSAWAGKPVPVVEAGRRYRLLTTVAVKPAKANTTSTTMTAKAGSQFEVVDVVGDTVHVRFKKVKGQTRADGKVAANDAIKGPVYAIPVDTLKYAVEPSQGPFFGSLTLPMKYRPNAGGTPDVVLSDIAITGAFGWTMTREVMNVTLHLTPIVFAGYANITTSQGDTTETEPGLTWGGGFAFSFTESGAGQFGVVIGGDHVTGDAGAEFPYQDRLWISLSLGVKFVDI